MTAQAHATSIAPGARVDGFDILSLRHAGLVSDIWAATPAEPWSRFDPSAATATIAIKALRSPFSLDERQREKMAREIALHGELAHPNIVRFVGSGSAEGSEYLAVEYVDGLTLRELLAANDDAPVPAGVALTLAASLCDALDYVHERRGVDGPLGLVHGAVNPDNVMVDRGGTLKLLDFGEAVGTHWARRAIRRGSRVGSFPESSCLAINAERYLGQLQYIAPEQLEASGRDRRSDVYAVGALLFELLTGAPPFDANDLSDLASRICSGERRRLREGLDGRVAALVADAMGVDPDARVETARDFALRIRAASTLYDGGSGAVAQCVQQAIGLGPPVLALEDEPPDTLRPGPGTELEHVAQDIFTRATQPGLRVPDVFRALARELSGAEDSDAGNEPPVRALRDANAMTAAVEFRAGVEGASRWVPLGGARGLGEGADPRPSQCYVRNRRQKSPRRAPLALKRRPGNANQES